MFKEIVDDAGRTPDIGRSQKLTMSTLCSGELKRRKCQLTAFSPFVKIFFIQSSTNFIIFVIFVSSFANTFSSGSGYQHFILSYPCVWNLFP